ncbi:MAG: hypothetical protein Q8K57_13265 [Thiobacillus sp.]|nr:hypothetical protein [Thiobacillus sp.]
MRPPVTYPVSLADLVNIADAAAELKHLRMFYIDHPSAQDRLANLARKLNDMVERAAVHDAALVYGKSEDPAEKVAP